MRLRAVCIEVRSLQFLLLQICSGLRYWEIDVPLQELGNSSQYYKE